MATKLLNVTMATKYIKFIMITIMTYLVLEEQLPHVFLETVPQSLGVAQGLGDCLGGTSSVVGCDSETLESS